MLRAQRGVLRMTVVACTAILSLSTSSAIATSAEITARDVTTALFKSNPDQPLDLSGKDLSNLDLGDLDFKGANLTGVNLYGTDLSSSNLSMTRLSSARLDRATISGANFTGADLSRATILRPNIFSTMEIDARELPTFENAKMIDANISGRLEGINFRGADLTGTFFGPRNPNGETLITPRIEMNGCDFTGAKLINADLSLNNAQYAKFANANLTGANLANANLSGADFTAADITNADFTGAAIEGALFNGVKGFDRAKGLKPAAPNVNP